MSGRVLGAAREVAKASYTKTRLVMQKVATLRRYRMPTEQRRPEEVVGILREARARGLFPDEPSLTESLHQEGEALLEAGRPTEALELWEHALARMAPSNHNRRRTELHVLRQWQADGRHREVLHRVELIATREPPDAYLGLAVLLADTARKTDDFTASDRLFAAFYATSEHSKTLAELEALPCSDLEGERLTDPARAADGIIAEFNPPPEPSRWVQALTDVEHAMRSFRTSFENGQWVNHCYDLSQEPNYAPRIIPDLGSYIG